MKRIGITENLVSRKGAVIAMALGCMLIYALPGLAENGDEFEVMWGTFGAAGESSGGEYSQIGSVLLTDGNDMSGGDFTVTEEFIASLYCVVDFRHFARFAEWWLEPDCDELNNWCDGADLNYLDGVDSVDLRLFVDEWLYYCPIGWPLK